MAAHARAQEHQPGTHAPVRGHYEELDIFGTPSGNWSMCARVNDCRTHPEVQLATARGGVLIGVAARSCQLLFRLKSARHSDESQQGMAARSEDGSLGLGRSR